MLFLFLSPFLQIVAVSCRLFVFDWSGEASRNPRLHFGLWISYIIFIYMQFQLDCSFFFSNRNPRLSITLNPMPNWNILASDCCRFVYYIHIYAFQSSCPALSREGRAPASRRCLGGRRALPPMCLGDGMRTSSYAPTTLHRISLEIDRNYPPCHRGRRI